MKSASMTQNDVIPDFDCVEAKREAQAEIYEEIRDLSPEEEIRYFEEQARKGPFRRLWLELIAKETPSREK
jgi:lipoprotein NlpI